MQVLIQRVSEASVTVDGSVVGKINKGLLALVGIEAHDTEETVQRAAQRLTKYRVFSDENGKMNLSVKDIEGGILVVSQFTLAADTKRGLRPSFSSAASPELAQELYLSLSQAIKESGVKVATGQFAADMKVALINDGPVTFQLEF
ncbi:D-aminoacyl-tRNA deacylase [Umboniibacter marinipuniceus]|uniref:D-aminoacyl-tRNA deacylase n=1 Tax=Umboniibacter marinipuniceus TaxID=569599 RepID=A0A3M0A6F4_9GAMM|nr:D-aminoacyl-tRNA deacylase [Umboniibacter marinipuniceus]RMA80167.1 D-tyrosyl-tRNA(Tyr) deacylase [Umboniibacter marinipuniceus]